MKLELSYNKFVTTFRAKRRKALERINRFQSKITNDKIELEAEKVNKFDAMKKEA